MVFEIGGRWSYSCYFVGCYRPVLFSTARSILEQLPSSFFSIRLVSIHVVHPYSSIDTTAAWKKELCFILSDRSDFHITDSLLIIPHAFASHVLMSFSADETLLLRKVNLSISLREPPFSVGVLPLWLKHMYSLCWHRGLCHLPLVPNYVSGIRLERKYYVIDVVRVHNSLCGVSSAFCLCQSKAIFFC